MNQRRGKTHAAALKDSQDISLRSLIEFVKSAKEALEQDSNESSYYFEMFEDYLRNDVASGKPLTFTYKSLGL